MDVNQIIKAPVLTEKSNSMREGDVKKYEFRVDTQANKKQVVDAIEKIFSVRPVKCNILMIKSKPRWTRTKSGHFKGATTPWKKAIVTLKKGEKIEIFEGV